MTQIVDGPADLAAALRVAGPGDTLRLRPGVYPKLHLWQKTVAGVVFDPPLVITSFDPRDPAVFSEMGVTGITGLRLAALAFRYVAAPYKPIYDKPFEVNDCAKVTLEDCTFTGCLSENDNPDHFGFATGFGLSVRKGADMTIQRNEFSVFYSALALGDVTGMRVIGNDIHAIRCDGITTTKCSPIVIEDNYFHDWARNLAAGDHADMVQFHTANAVQAITNITIRKNTLDIGGGHHTQGLFLGNEQGGNPDLYYRDVLIEENTIINAHLNGLVLGSVVGAVIRNNTLLHAPGGAPRGDLYTEMPRIRVDQRSSDVTITGNRAAAWPDNPAWSISDNIKMQVFAPGGPGYYADAYAVLAAAVPDLAPLQAVAQVTVEAGQLVLRVPISAIFDI